MASWIPRGATEIIENLRFPHAGIGFFETGDDGLHIGIAWGSDFVIIVGSAKREDRMAIPRADFDDAALDAETVHLPVIGLGKSLEGGNNDTARNVAAVLLADNIIELAVSHEVDAAASVHVGSSSPDECDRGAPRFGTLGEVKAVRQHEPPRIAGSGFVPATRIFFCRSLRLASLDIAIETAPKQIGAVRGVPDKTVVGSRNSGRSWP
jgi:hypothetical protein